MKRGWHPSRITKLERDLGIGKVTPPATSGVLHVPLEVYMRGGVGSAPGGGPASRHGFLVAPPTPGLSREEWSARAVAYDKDLQARMAAVYSDMERAMDAGRTAEEAQP